MDQMVAADLLGEMPVLAGERPHHVGLAHVLEPEAVGEVERESGRKRLGDVGPVVLVKAEGEGDTSVGSRATAAKPDADAFSLLRVRQSKAVVRGQPIVCEAHLAWHVLGHLGELVLDVPGRRGAEVPRRHATALAPLRA